ncbi:MAG: DUF4910 domain-containing protein [Anaerolineae bacterium]
MKLSVSACMHTFHAAVSGERAWQTVCDLARYHRIQATPGFRAAAEYVLARLQAAGVEARLHTYPADGKTAFWTSVQSPEWEVQEAALDLLVPGEPPHRLADFSACPISLIQRSAPFAGEADIVDVGQGDCPEDYEGLDVAGHVVLAEGDVQAVYEQAVRRRGAVGILYHGLRPIPPVRERLDLPDVRAYASFWWEAGDTPCFGFVLTPRQGEALRARLREGAARGEKKAPLRVRARVVSRLYEGTFEVVEGFLPGQSDETVVLVAHLCHPRPGANDNASGSAALLEAATTLQRLLQEGLLPPLRRGVRFLWVPEMAGTYAYLATHEGEIPRTVAGLNLDMVGERQDQCGSTFLIERPPEALASFAPELLERLREDLFGGTPLVGFHGPAGFRHAVSPFSGGSDHYILSDPTVGIPTPMLIQWPDRFWHTTEDTPDRVDPQMLARAAALAGAYAWFLGHAGPEEARWLGHEMLTRFRARTSRVAQGLLTEGAASEDAEALGRHWLAVQKRLAFLQERQAAALETLLRLDEGLSEEVARWRGEVRAWCQAEEARVEEALTRRAQALGLEALPLPPTPALDPWEREAARLIPRRLYRGPISTRFLLSRLPDEDREALEALLRSRAGDFRRLLSLAEYWADGTRSVGEIAERVEMESGERDVELLVRMFRALEKAGLAELREEGRGDAPQ